MARAFQLPTRWDAPVTLGEPVTVDLEALANLLIGTYELDSAQSDNPRTVIERLTNDLPANERRRVVTSLLPRLRRPQRLALERQGQRVTVASSLQPAHSYQLNGQAFTPDAAITSAATVALQYGDQFRLETTGPLDGNYTVAYDVTQQGAQLHVSQTALLPQFARPVVVISRYKKVSDVPRWDLAEKAASVPTRRKP